MSENSVKRRGFGSMDPGRQKELASKGGKAAHSKGVAHEWTSEEAKAAGRKGGIASRGGRGKITEPPAQLEEIKLPSGGHDRHSGELGGLD